MKKIKSFEIFNENKDNDLLPIQDIDFSYYILGTGFSSNFTNFLENLDAYDEWYDDQDDNLDLDEMYSEISLLQSSDNYSECKSHLDNINKILSKYPSYKEIKIDRFIKNAIGELFMIIENDLIEYIVFEDDNFNFDDLFDLFDDIMHKVEILDLNLEKNYNIIIQDIETMMKKSDIFLTTQGFMPRFLIENY
jgi:DNA-directed RNA polymerase beta' subunit